MQLIVLFESLEQNMPEENRQKWKPDPKDQRFDRIWWIFVYTCFFLGLVIFILLLR